MRVMILGGDGFIGWPTALRLSALDYEVMIIDNYLRRDADISLGVQSLTPIAELPLRRSVWRQVGGKDIQVQELNVAQESYSLHRAFSAWRPDVVIHFAEQKSAPYSMRSGALRRFTVDANVNATNNVLSALVESRIDAHLIHMGTMGVYGYGTFGDMPIPEGYLGVNVRANGKEVAAEILHPTNPGSIYHMTKVLDQVMFAFYAKNDGLRITDLHQGIVWGTQTAETKMAPELINRFDYDENFGTVLNRFLMQAAAGFPLTVHGTGGQKRAFIHLQDSVRCIELAIKSPPKAGDRVKIMNQTTEAWRVIDLARMISKQTGVPYDNVDNPRKEAAENELEVVASTLPSLGLRPTLLEEGLMAETRDIASKYLHRADLSKIPCKTRWTV